MHTYCCCCCCKLCCEVPVQTQHYYLETNHSSSVDDAVVELIHEMYVIVSSSTVVLSVDDDSSLLRTLVEQTSSSLLQMSVDNDDSVQCSVQYMVYFGGAFYLFSQIINPANFQANCNKTESSYGWQRKILVDEEGTQQWSDCSTKLETGTQKVGPIMLSKTS